MGNSLFSGTMNSLVTFTYFFLFAMTPGLMDQALETVDQDGGCEVHDSLYTGCDLTDDYDVDGWHACGQLCILVSGCLKWHILDDRYCILHRCDKAVPNAKEGAIRGEHGC